MGGGGLKVRGNGRGEEFEREKGSSSKRVVRCQRNEWDGAAKTYSRGDGKTGHG